MNFLKSFFLLLVLLSVATCADDDDDMLACTQADWVGTYSGTQDCDGTVEDITVTISASGTSNLIISYETATATAQYSPLEFQECSLVARGVSLGSASVALDANRGGTATKN